MRTQTIFLAGLVLGSVMGLATLLAGPAVLLPGLVIWTWLIVRRPRFVGASGGFIGFGAAWLMLLGQAVWRCANDATCTQIDPAPWLAFGGAFVAIGVVLGLVSLRRLRRVAHSPPPGPATAS